MRKWNLSLTYEPKIQPVIDGTCTQTIRTVGKAGRKSVGDLISFHGWQGRPYRSSWSWRMPYTPMCGADGGRCIQKGREEWCIIKPGHRVYR